MQTTSTSSPAAAASAAAQLRQSILEDDSYARQRKQRRQEIIDLKRHRRIAVGPYAVLHFENFATMLYQIQEMLWIEKGGDEQLEDELQAYAPLVPNGRELVATMMLEIENKSLREAVLLQLGDIDTSTYLEIAGEKSHAQPEQDAERTTADGKTSSVHFLHFPLTDAQASAMQNDSAEVRINIEHPHYNYRVILSPEQKQALAADLL